MPQRPTLPPLPSTNYGPPPQASRLTAPANKLPVLSMASRSKTPSLPLLLAPCLPSHTLYPPNAVDAASRATSPLCGTSASDHCSRAQRMLLSSHLFLFLQLMSSHALMAWKFRKQQPKAWQGPNPITQRASNVPNGNEKTLPKASQQPQQKQSNDLHSDKHAHDRSAFLMAQFIVRIPRLKLKFEFAPGHPLWSTV